MKKVFLSLAVIASVAMVSCKKGNTTDADAEKAKQDSIEAAAKADSIAAAEAAAAAQNDTITLVETDVVLTDSVNA